MIAGYVDGYGIITYNTYLSFMSGNTTQAGYRTGQGDFTAVWPSAIAIVSFVCGTFAGALLAHSSVRQTRKLVFGVVAASLALIISLTRLGMLPAGIYIAVVSLAMGVMNTALSRVGAVSVNLTFVTGTLSRLGTHLALAVRRLPLEDSQGSWDTHLHRALALAGIWLGFLVGALLSGGATPRLGVWGLLFPMLILSTLAWFDRTNVL
jgi:uncharacterized membrane protein YoaK (UPF0700 family)